MKATVLVRDLVKLIAKHGDLDVKMGIETSAPLEVFASVKCVDELTAPSDKVYAFEIYGEEQ